MWYKIPAVVQRGGQQAYWEGMHVGRTGLGDIFYKRQINQPSCRFLRWCSSHPISFSISSLLAPLSSGDLELSLTASDTRADGAEECRFLMTVAKMFYYFFFSLELTNWKRNVHKAAMNNVPLASMQSLNCLHSLWLDWQLQSFPFLTEFKNVSNAAANKMLEMTSSLHLESF